jgi:hypothetical protein
MKKILSILLVIIMLFAIVACEKAPNNSNNTTEVYKDNTPSDTYLFEEFSFSPERSIGDSFEQATIAIENDRKNSRKVCPKFLKIILLIK